MSRAMCLTLLAFAFCIQTALAAETETWIDNFSVPGPVADRYEPASRVVQLNAPQLRLLWGQRDRRDLARREAHRVPVAPDVASRNPDGVPRAPPVIAGSGESQA